MLPYYPLEDDKGHEYKIFTSFEHMVSQYVGVSMLEVEQMDYLDYMLYRRDAFIHMLSQTEKGVEYLNNAWRIEQTKPNRKELKTKFGKEG